jgi:hypothetical protein
MVWRAMRCDSTSKEIDLRTTVAVLARKQLARIVVLASSLFLVVTATASAQAATGPSASRSGGTLAAEKLVVQKVADASDHSAAFRSLSAGEKALFRQALTHLTGVTVISRGAPVTTSSASGDPCWYWYWNYRWSDLGVTEGYTWMQLNWCSNGSSITSYSTTNYGGQGENGFTYDGVAARGSLNVGWEVRSYVEFHFNIMGLNADPCMQIRGGATGLHSLRTTCNLS